MSGPRRVRLKLESIYGEAREVSFIPQGRITYLWVGPDNAGGAFGWADGRKLGKFIERLYGELGKPARGSPEEEREKRQAKRGKKRVSR